MLQADTAIRVCHCQAGSGRWPSMATWEHGRLPAYHVCRVYADAISRPRGKASDRRFPRETGPMQSIGKTPAPLCALHARRNRSRTPAKPDAPGGHVVCLKMQCACPRLERCSVGLRWPSGKTATGWIVGIMREHSRAARKARRYGKAAAERQHRRGFGMVVLTLTRGPRVRHGKGEVEVERGSSSQGAGQKRIKASRMTRRRVGLPESSGGWGEW